MHDSTKQEARGANTVLIKAGVTRRDVLKVAVGGSLALATGLNAPAVIGQAKQFAGVTLRGACFQHHFQTGIIEQLPEFERLTGIKVNLELQSFPIYNQRMDLELSTKGSSYDFCNVTFPYSGRWIGSGWLSPLDEFTKDVNATPPDWNPDDFVSGAQTAFRDAQGRTYGFAWVAGVMMTGIARADILDKAGLKPPQTMDELAAVCAATNSASIAAFVNDKLHHWEWIPYLMGFGGSVFKDAPTDLTPTLNTPAAVAAAQFYADLLTKYSPQGVLSYTDDQAQRAQMSGRANIRTTALDWLLALGKAAESQVRDTVRYIPMPSGSAGRFPAVNGNAYGIPAGAKEKRAAWEFIKWSLSKDMVKRMALEKDQLATARRSVIGDPEFRKRMTVNGQDVAALYLDTMDRTGQRGYMKYRTLPSFPQVGEKINKAIERIASGQSTAAVAMAAAQEEAIADLRKAGAI